MIDNNVTEEDIKITQAYEERKEKESFKPIDFEEFIKEREEKYKIKF